MQNIINVLSVYLTNNQYVVLDKTTLHFIPQIKLVLLNDEPKLLVDYEVLNDFTLNLSQDGRFITVGDRINTGYDLIMNLDAWTATNLVSLLNQMKNMGLSKTQWNKLTTLMTKN